MAQVLNTDEMLQPLSAEAPCGDDLEYDDAFVAMEQLARGKEEQKVGDSVLPGEEADWRAVERNARELFTRTRDLRVAVFLTRALIATHGLPGLRDGLTVVHGLIERYWETCHPALDPSDGNDPTLRVNTLLNLCSLETLRSVRGLQVASARGIGNYTFQDYLVATGKMPATAQDGATVPEVSHIEAAFLAGDVDELRANAEASSQAPGLVESIETTLMEKVGPTQAVSFAPLQGMLKDLSELLANQVARHGGGPVTTDVEQAMVPAAPGEIRSREDAIRLLDQICDYFQKHEPSSPVPLLLRRAKKLVSKGFVDIVRDLAPAGVQEVEKIIGRESE